MLSRSAQQRQTTFLITFVINSFLLRPTLARLARFRQEFPWRGGAGDAAPVRHQCFGPFSFANLDARLTRVVGE